MIGNSALVLGREYSRQEGWKESSVVHSSSSVTFYDGVIVLEKGFGNILHSDCRVSLMEVLGESGESRMAAGLELTCPLEPLSTWGAVDVFSRNNEGFIFTGRAEIYEGFDEEVNVIYREFDLNLLDQLLGQDDWTTVTKSERFLEALASGDEAVDAVREFANKYFEGSECLELDDLSTIDGWKRFWLSIPHAGNTTRDDFVLYDECQVIHGVSYFCGTNSPSPLFGMKLGVNDPSVYMYDVELGDGTYEKCSVSLAELAVQMLIREASYRYYGRKLTLDQGTALDIEEIGLTQWPTDPYGTKFVFCDGAYGIEIITLGRYEMVSSSHLASHLRSEKE